jgi:hypothetical protein
MRAKKITRKFLEDKKACTDGKEWCLSHGELTLQELYPIFLEHKKHEWFNWLLVRVMNKKQKVYYAIFAAEQVIGFYENKYPDDPRPRKAIEAAKAYLANPCARTKRAAAAAADAAAYAADAAAYAAYAADAAAYAAAVADAAAYAADAAAYAADAAADAAAYAAYDAADAAYAADAAKEEMYNKILEYGYNLLK